MWFLLFSLVSAGLTYNMFHPSERGERRVIFVFFASWLWGDLALHAGDVLGQELLGLAGGVVARVELELLIRFGDGVGHGGRELRVGQLQDRAGLTRALRAHMEETASWREIDRSL